jgi:hypothetical protein
MLVKADKIKQMHLSFQDESITAILRPLTYTMLKDSLSETTNRKRVYLKHSKS